MANSRLEIQLSERLKRDFEEMCDENETSMSVEVRKIIANLVRNHKRQSDRTADEQAVKPSKSTK